MEEPEFVSWGCCTKWLDCWKHQERTVPQIWHQVWAGLCSSAGSGGGCVLPLPAPGCPGRPWLVASSIQSLPVFTWPLLCVPPLLTRTPVIGLEPTLHECGLFLTPSICKDPIPKCRHILRIQVIMNLGGTLQPTISPVWAAGVGLLCVLSKGSGRGTRVAIRDLRGWAGVCGFRYMWGWGRTGRRKVGLSQETRVPVPCPPPYTHAHTHRRSGQRLSSSCPHGPGAGSCGS